MPADSDADGRGAARLAEDVGYVAVAARPEAVRVADALRRLLAASVTTPATADELTAAAEELEAVAARLEEGAAASRFDGLPTIAGGGIPFPLATHPLLGPANALGPPLHVEKADGIVRARARYTPAYEGHAGRVHGGHVAAAFDVVLGFAASLSGHAVVTGTLTVKYVRAVPLDGELVYEGETDRVEGRKVFVRGRLLAFDDVPVAEAEAVFVSVPRDGTTARR